MKIDEKLIHELSEIIVGSILIVISFNIGFNSIEKIVISIVFILIGGYYIFKANRSYKRRRNHATR